MTPFKEEDYVEQELPIETEPVQDTSECIATWEDYVRAATRTAVYPHDDALEYTELGLLSEIGEFAGVLKRNIRDRASMSEKYIDECSDILWYLAMFWYERSHAVHGPFPEIREGLETRQEASDVLRSMVRKIALDPYEAWPILHDMARLASYMRMSLQDVCVYNVQKLARRARENTLHGAGDR